MRISILQFSLFIVCIFLFFNLMLGFGISEWFFRGKYWTGFSILTGFYVLLAVIFAAVQSLIEKKVESGVMKGIKGTPLELKEISEIMYPNSQVRKNIEEVGIPKQEEENKLTQQEAQQALAEQELREIERLNEQNQENK